MKTNVVLTHFIISTRIYLRKIELDTPEYGFDHIRIPITYNKMQIDKWDRD